MHLFLFYWLQGRVGREPGTCAARLHTTGGLLSVLSPNWRSALKRHALLLAPSQGLIEASKDDRCCMLVLLLDSTEQLHRQTRLE